MGPETLSGAPLGSFGRHEGRRPPCTTTEAGGSLLCLLEKSEAAAVVWLTQHAIDVGGPPQGRQMRTCMFARHACAPIIATNTGDHLVPPSRWDSLHYMHMGMHTDMDICMDMRMNICMDEHRHAHGHDHGYRWPARGS